MYQYPVACHSDFNQNTSNDMECSIFDNCSQSSLCPSFSRNLLTYAKESDLDSMLRVLWLQDGIIATGTDFQWKITSWNRYLSIVLKKGTTRDVSHLVCLILYCQTKQLHKTERHTVIYTVIPCKCVTIMSELDSCNIIQAK